MYGFRALVGPWETFVNSISLGDPMVQEPLARVIIYTKRKVSYKVSYDRLPSFFVHYLSKSLKRLWL